MRRIAFGLVFVGIVAHAPAQGPIETRNHRVPSLMFLRFEPRGALLTTGQTETSFSLTVANDLRISPTIREDAETARLGLRYRRGYQFGEFEAELPILSRSGGLLDPIIEWWHEHVLGVIYVRRDIPYARSEIILPGSGRFGSASGLGDASFKLSRNVTPTTTLSVGLKLPTGDASRLLGSGNADLGVNLGHRVGLLKNLTLYAESGLVYQGNATKLAGTRSFVHQESLALVYARNSRDTWNVQWQGEASALRTRDSGSDSPHRMLTFGITRRISANDHLQLFFSEDGDLLNFRVPEVVNIAPDFTVGVRLSRRF